jgi:hypothetical protein
MTTRLQLCFPPTALILSTSDFGPLDEPYIAMGVGDKPAVYNFREFLEFTPPLADISA